MMGYLINFVVDKTSIYLEKKTKVERKKIGQFFTSAETAEYMASMFSVPNKETISVLDAGAGTGILTAAVVERLQKETEIKYINITCYETNEDILSILEDNMLYLKKMSTIPLEYNIITENYITSQSEDFNTTMFAQECSIKYDWIIGNPPYKKIAKDAIEARSMPSVCYGAPNLYFLFTTMGVFNLECEGEMVYIIPRSWTSGAYFKSFREYLLKEGNLRQIHLFVSRDKVFEQENVLQETIIIKVDKTKKRDLVKITSSQSNSDFENIHQFEVPYKNIILGSEKYVYLVTNEEELKVLETLGKWEDTLPSLGLKMKTGLVVDFRSREYLRNEAEEGTVPLFYAQHIKNGRVIFPIAKEDEYITTEKKSFIQKNRNYLLVKRFTTKEEKRRFQCGIYLSSDLPEYDYISTQNKVNFIEGLFFDMSKELTYGLYVLFNSTLYDIYYRILNGSTQVNSTEVNGMPVPPLEIIEKMGELLLKRDNLTVEACDEILEDIING